MDNAIHIIALALVRATFTLSWATVGLCVVVEAAIFKASLESGRVAVKLTLPVLCLVHGQIIVAPFLGEAIQLGQSLRWVTWWDFLVVTGIDGGNSQQGKGFHFYFISKDWSPC